MLLPNEGLGLVRSYTSNTRLTGKGHHIYRDINIQYRFVAEIEITRRPSANLRRKKDAVCILIQPALRAATKLRH